ncbi:FAD-dependent oxidoreductase [Enhygromyxa salina]|uniref:Coenzyme A disulfide reductase n=1 Tax=Enhygromyxa salina TaxID=215803 RepID=A0A2S9YC18_9BACT|nr:FAD-dependent oxidoreductase [Enhygromyxa salina]PRQ02602.1 coenzyme A disulfide reductase [Enhygromyxa salina]
MTLFEGPQLLPEYSAGAAAQAGRALAAAGVDVRLGVGVDEVARKGKKVVALRARDVRIDTDLVLITTGVRPRTEIFAAAGGGLGPDGSIRVDARCATGSTASTRRASA